jgi:poly(ADP-ribose) glycohydrolase ARH3
MGDAPPQQAAQELGLSQTVAQTLPFALYSFLTNRNSFEECIYCAVLQGGDPDTLGAIAGAFSGSYLGVKNIPKDWRSRLENRDLLEDLAKRLDSLDV